MGLSIHLQAAAELAPAETGDLSTIIERCRQEVKAAIAESRRSVSNLRQSPNTTRSLTDMIAELTHEFRSCLPCELRIHQYGFAASYSPQQVHTIYRTVQEALTNIQKHARDVQEVSITFDYKAQWRVVRIENFGGSTHVNGTSLLAANLLPVGTGSYAVNGHYGLAGLRERAEQLGGWLKAGPVAGNGFIVELGLPGEEVVL
jgi:signal transduction histidine kinase